MMILNPDLPISTSQVLDYRHVLPNPVDFGGVLYYPTDYSLFLSHCQPHWCGYYSDRLSVLAPHPVNVVISVADLPWFPGN